MKVKARKFTSFHAKGEKHGQKRGDFKLKKEGGKKERPARGGDTGCELRRGVKERVQTKCEGGVRAKINREERSCWGIQREVALG